jgi:hypothetical protein
MAVAAYYGERLLHIPFAGAHLVSQAARVFSAIAMGLAALAVSAHLLRIEEFTQFRRRAFAFRTW